VTCSSFSVYSGKCRENKSEQNAAIPCVKCDRGKVAYSQCLNYSINATLTHLIFDNNFDTKRVRNASLAKSGSFKCDENLPVSVNVL